jgi:hypothetical protein
MAVTLDGRVTVVRLAALYAKYNGMLVTDVGMLSANRSMAKDSIALSRNVTEVGMVRTVRPPESNRWEGRLLTEVGI